MGSGEGGSSLRLGPASPRTEEAGIDVLGRHALKCRVVAPPNLQDCFPRQGSDRQGRSGNWGMQQGHSGSPPSVLTF